MKPECVIKPGDAVMCPLGEEQTIQVATYLRSMECSNPDHLHGRPIGLVLTFLGLNHDGQMQYAHPEKRRSNWYTPTRILSFEEFERLLNPLPLIDNYLIIS